MENENERRKIHTKLFNNLVGDHDNTSATAHQIGELRVWRGECAYGPNDANNFNEAENEVLIEYLCRLLVEPVGCMFIVIYIYEHL